MKQLLASALLAALLTGCGADDSADDPSTGSDSVVGTIEVLDGHTYHCFRYTSAYRGGLWCTEVQP